MKQKCYTARFMGRNFDDEKKIRKKDKVFTINQLKSWGLKYHKIFFGKPNFDILFDDKSFEFDKDGLIRLINYNYIFMKNSIKIYFQGGLDNQLFQFSTSYLLAKKKKYLNFISILMDMKIVQEVLYLINFIKSKFKVSNN